MGRVNAPLEVRGLWRLRCAVPPRCRVCGEGEVLFFDDAPQEGLCETCGAPVEVRFEVAEEVLH